MMWILAKLTLAIVAALLLIVVLMVGSTYFGLNDEVDGSYDFDPSSIPEDLDRYLLDTEGQVPNLHLGQSARAQQIHRTAMPPPAWLRGA